MSELDIQEIEAIGLHPGTIELHHKRIKWLLKKKAALCFPIQDCARTDNGGIVPYETLVAWSSHKPRAENIVAFVPAAGAASRYFQPFCELRECLVHQEQPDPKLLKKLALELDQQGALNWPLPPNIRKWIETKSQAWSPKDRQKILEEIQEAKALQPANLSGESFLELKLKEHARMDYLSGECYVVADGKSEKFNDKIEELETSPLPKIVLEQGPALSTLRFLENAQVYRDKKGRLSSVPAGHGTLVHLMAEVKERLPDTKGLFIRNIDNTMGSTAEAYQASQVFLSAFSWLLDKLDDLRRAIKEEDLKQASKLAIEILGPNTSSTNNTKQLAFLSRFGEDQANCWRLLFEKFHCSPALANKFIQESSSSLSALERLLNRPLNFLGQVPNSGKDVGGSPVFSSVDGIDFTICLELPHASAQDRKDFLENTQKATHFNPVFVASEICGADMYLESPWEFWLAARKKMGKTHVVYHETVLYELLGNSILSNVVFPELPRSVFNPHKSLTD